MVNHTCEKCGTIFNKASNYKKHIGSRKESCVQDKQNKSNNKIIEIP